LSRHTGLLSLDAPVNKLALDGFEAQTKLPKTA
jgi:hypothetical protein